LLLSSILTVSGIDYQSSLWEFNSRRR